MVLNRAAADPAHLRIMILSAPKTGNTWLRLLLHHVYGVPQVELPTIWDAQVAARLPDAFVAHQHYQPTEHLVGWLVANRVTVFSTIRHPADTFLSLFHYLQWHVDESDPYQQLMRKDGGAPGAHAHKYARSYFPLSYGLTLAWEKLGSRVVRYEDLLHDPVAELTRATSVIGQVDPVKISAAAFLCQPERAVAVGSVDERHARTREPGRWRTELPADIVETLRTQEPFATASARHRFDWSADAAEAPPFDYRRIDPFGGRRHFANGQPIGTYLAKVYYCHLVDAPARFPDPCAIGDGSYWRWLLSPASIPHSNPRYPAETYTNLMDVIYRSRPDLQKTYPDVADNDRIGFLAWFTGFACAELEIPWGIVSAAVDAHCRYLLVHAPSDPEASTARITSLRVLDAAGKPADTFACGDPIRVEIEIHVAKPITDPVVGFSLRTWEGAVIFGTNTSVLGAPAGQLQPGRYVCVVRSELTVTEQSCFVSVGLSRLGADGAAMPIHRLFDQKRIRIRGAKAFGNAWCPTSMELRAVEAPEPEKAPAAPA